MLKGLNLWRKHGKKSSHGAFGTVYVLTNFNTTMEENLHRVYTLRDMGYDPYIMIYDKPNSPRDVRMLARWCNNKIIFKSTKRFEDYDPKRGYALLVPIIYRPDAMRPFGHSRISRSCMSLMQGAMRTLFRSEVSAEFYSFPQKYILGLSADTEFEKFQATISSFLNITQGEEGELPKVGQFTQQSMSPFIEQIKTFGSLFAGETGLTTDDLGFVVDNPSSAEAIKASHENLRLMARKAQKTFGSGLLNAGFLAACVRDDNEYRRNEIYQTKVMWEPVFEPDAAMLSGIGDGAIKLNQAVPGYFGPKNMQNLTGIAPEG